jgi:CelD/BcsL family acetyltransferase involved in cellulose biosynthesis
MLNISEINDYNQLLNFKNDWDTVAKRSINENIFLTWEWCSTYWKHLGKGKKLIVLKIEDDNESIAFAPLRQSKLKLFNWFECKVIEPMCCGPTDYNDFSITKREEECLQLIFKYLYANCDWDIIHLKDISESAVLFDYLQLIQEYDYSLKKGIMCPYLSLSKSSPIKLSTKFRQNLRRRMSNLKKDYDNVEVKSYDKFSTVEKAMEAFFKLHQNRWLSKNMPSVLSYDTGLKFHLDVAKKFAEKGWLALYFLIVDEEPIASDYAFKFNNKIYQYLSGFNEDFSKYSPGHLLTNELINIFRESGINKLDFLRGEEKYKQDWCSSYSMNYNFKFVNRASVKLYYRIKQLLALNSTKNIKRRISNRRARSAQRGQLYQARTAQLPQT